MGEHACQLIAAGFSGHDEAKHQKLAVDTGAAQDASDPAVEAEINKGRERPDFFRLDEAAEDSGKKADGGVEGEGKVFAVVECGNGKDNAAEHGPARTDEQAEENDCLERNVGGEKIGDRSADPDAESEGNEEKGQQRESLAGASIFGEEQATEGAAARQHAGHGRHHAQFYQERDQDEPVSHPSTVSRCRCAAQMQTRGGQQFALVKWAWFHPM